MLYFTIFDWYAFAALMFFVILGLYNGFANEVFAVIRWFLILAVSSWAVVPLAHTFSDISVVTATIFAFVIIAVFISLLLRLLFYTIFGSFNLQHSIGLSSIGGLVVGTLKGIFLCALCIEILSLSSLVENPAWEKAHLLPKLHVVGKQIRPMFESLVSDKWQETHSFEKLFNDSK